MDKGEIFACHSIRDMYFLPNPACATCLWLSGSAELKSVGRLLRHRVRRCNLNLVCDAKRTFNCSAAAYACSRGELCRRGLFLSSTKTDDKLFLTAFKTGCFNLLLRSWWTINWVGAAPLFSVRLSRSPFETNGNFKLLLQPGEVCRCTDGLLPLLGDSSVICKQSPVIWNQDSLINHARKFEHYPLEHFPIITLCWKLCSKWFTMPNFINQNNSF